MKKYILLFSFISIAAAQLVSFGVNAGVPIGDQSYGRNEAKPFLVGPAVEFRPLQHFGVEVDALYNRTSYTATFLGFPDGSVSTYRQNGDSWTFPVLGKYYFRPQNVRWQPFVAVGLSVRTTSYTYDGNIVSIIAGPSLTTINTHQESRPDPGVGGTAALGLRYQIIGRYALEPQLRYTYWNHSDANLRQNEGSFQLGLRF